MNREIKFRAYIKNLKWMVPVERFCFDTKTVEVDLSSGNGDTAEYDYDLGEVEIMQFTGLTDKNGVEIYEGDICDTHTHWGKGEVIFEYGMFRINGITLISFKPGIEVVGNVHERLKRSEGALRW